MSRAQTETALVFSISCVIGKPGDYIWHRLNNSTRSLLPISLLVFQAHGEDALPRFSQPHKYPLVLLDPPPPPPPLSSLSSSSSKSESKTTPLPSLPPGVLSSSELLFSNRTSTVFLMAFFFDREKGRGARMGNRSSNLHAVYLNTAGV